jgi:hypothetical protein
MHCKRPGALPGSLLEPIYGYLLSFGRWNCQKIPKKLPTGNERVPLCIAKNDPGGYESRKKPQRAWGFAAEIVDFLRFSERSLRNCEGVRQSGACFMIDWTLSATQGLAIIGGFE